MMDDDDRYLCMGELTELLSINRRTVYRMVRDDPSFLAPVYIRARSPRWRQSAINEWLATAGEYAERTRLKARAKAASRRHGDLLRMIG